MSNDLVIIGSLFWISVTVISVYLSNKIYFFGSIPEEYRAKKVGGKQEKRKGPVFIFSKGRWRYWTGCKYSIHENCLLVENEKPYSFFIRPIKINLRGKVEIRKNIVMLRKCVVFELYGSSAKIALPEKIWVDLKK